VVQEIVCTPLLSDLSEEAGTSGVIYHLGEATVAVARIVSNPDVMLGKPVVEGTRITVELILEKLSGGESVEEILDSYPTLTREGVLAAIKYAADVLRLDVVYPVGA
jgi:uncharacterized protein (DUF433 family)